MRTLFVCLVLLLFINVVHLSNCIYTYNRVVYDMSGLTYDPTQPSPPGYSGQDAEGRTYFINFCEQVSQVTVPECNSVFPSSSCQEESDGIYRSAGATNTQGFSSSWNGMCPTLANLSPCGLHSLASQRIMRLLITTLLVASHCTMCQGIIVLSMVDLDLPSSWLRVIQPPRLEALLACTTVAAITPCSMYP